MKRFALILFVLLGTTVLGQEVPNTVESLAGIWQIDLRPTPDAPDYFQPFEVTKLSERSFQGTFYGSSINNALVNDAWDKLHFAFTTKDRSSTYYHSGYLDQGVLYGMTYCPDRGFTAPWTGTKTGEE